MNKHSKIKTILLLVVIISIALVGLLTFKGKRQHEYNDGEYTELIKELSEVISTLQADIALYQAGIEEMNKEKEHLLKQLEYVRKNYKESDTDIVNGNADYNFRFLSDFLSEDGN